jgi:hypothetical protein
MKTFHREKKYQIREDDLSYFFDYLLFVASHTESERYIDIFCRELLPTINKYGLNEKYLNRIEFLTRAVDKSENLVEILNGKLKEGNVKTRVEHECLFDVSIDVIAAITYMVAYPSTISQANFCDFLIGYIYNKSNKEECNIIFHVLETKLAFVSNVLLKYQDYNTDSMEYQWLSHLHARYDETRQYKVGDELVYKMECKYYISPQCTLNEEETLKRNIQIVKI